MAIGQTSTNWWKSKVPTCTLSRRLNPITVGRNFFLLPRWLDPPWRTSWRNRQSRLQRLCLDPWCIARSPGRYTATRYDPVIAKPFWRRSPFQHTKLMGIYRFASCLFFSSFLRKTLEDPGKHCTKHRLVSTGEIFVCLFYYEGWRSYTMPTTTFERPSRSKIQDSPYFQRPSLGKCQTLNQTGKVPVEQKNFTYFKAKDWTLLTFEPLYLAKSRQR